MKELKELERQERIKNQDLLNEKGVRNVEAEKLKHILTSRGLEVSEVSTLNLFLAKFNSFK